MDDSNEKCAEALLEVVPRILSALRAQFRSGRGPELSIAQFRMLAFIGRNPGCALSDAANDLGLSAPSASRQVDGLIAAGFARRNADALDRRRVALSLTAAGQRQYRAVRKRGRAFLAGQLHHLTENERATLLEALGSLRAVFEDTHTVESS